MDSSNIGNNDNSSYYLNIENKDNTHILVRTHKQGRNEWSFQDYLQQDKTNQLLLFKDLHTYLTLAM